MTERDGKTVLAELVAKLETWSYPAMNETEVRAIAAYVKKLEAENERQSNALDEIAEFAHQNSTGPAIPDEFWSIGDMAYRASETAPETTARIQREVSLEFTRNSS